MGNTPEDWDYEKFQNFVVRHAFNRGIVGRKALADVADLKVGMLSKWYNGVERPSPESLQKLADATGAPYLQLLVAAGRATATEDTQPIVPLVTLHPRALELNSMLAESSPLNEEDRVLLDTLIDSVVDRFRKQMKTRRRGA